MKPTARELFLAFVVMGFGAFVAAKIYEPRRQTAYKYQCASNLKQIGLAMIMYSQDNDETFPRAQAVSSFKKPAKTWMFFIQPYVKDTAIFRCPADKRNPDNGKPYYGSYLMNHAYYKAGDAFTPPDGASLSKIRQPSSTILVSDGDGNFRLAWPDAKATPRINGTPEQFGSLVARHGVGIPLYCDGHVLWNSFAYWLDIKTLGGRHVATGLTIEAD